MMSVARKTFTVIEAAVCLGVSRNTAYRAVRDGTIPSIRVGRRIVVPAHALEAILSGDGGQQPLRASA
ncbi:MAG: helix-turn-helix domain-containing protein [Armatimonadetes bacterium]|nr:helix-turn-helix domain-containing protein [Armatimonadota bacterium]